MYRCQLLAVGVVGSRSSHGVTGSFLDLSQDILRRCRRYSQKCITSFLWHTASATKFLYVFLGFVATAPNTWINNFPCFCSAITNLFKLILSSVQLDRLPIISHSMHCTLDFGNIIPAYFEQLLGYDIRWLWLYVNVLLWSLQVMHGGLFSEDNVTLDDIRKIDRNRQPPDSGW